MGGGGGGKKRGMGGRSTHRTDPTHLAAGGARHLVAHCICVASSGGVFVTLTQKPLREECVLGLCKKIRIKKMERLVSIRALVFLQRCSIYGIGIAGSPYGRPPRERQRGCVLLHAPLPIPRSLQPAPPQPAHVRDPPNSNDSHRPTPFPPTPPRRRLPRRGVRRGGRVGRVRRLPQSNGVRVGRRQGG